MLHYGTAVIVLFLNLFFIKVLSLRAQIFSEMYYGTARVLVPHSILYMVLCSTM